MAAQSAQHRSGSGRPKRLLIGRRDSKGSGALTNRAKLVLEALSTNLANRQAGMTDQEAPLIRSYQPAPGWHWDIVAAFNQRAGCFRRDLSYMVSTKDGRGGRKFYHV
jgi:hypothetical protein